MTKLFSYSTTQDHARQLDELAAALQVSKAEVIRQAVGKMHRDRWFHILSTKNEREATNV